MAPEEQTSISIKWPSHQHKLHGMRVHLQEPSDLQGEEYTSRLNLTAIKPPPIHYRLVANKFHINIMYMLKAGVDQMNLFIMEEAQIQIWEDSHLTGLVLVTLQLEQIYSMMVIMPPRTDTTLRWRIWMQIVWTGHYTCLQETGIEGDIMACDI